MLDIKFVRENPEAVKENIRKKYQDAKLPMVDEVIAKDEEARKAQVEADSLRSERNTISKQIGGLMKEGRKDEAAALVSEAGRGLAMTPITDRRRLTISACSSSDA